MWIAMSNFAPNAHKSTKENAFKGYLKMVNNALLALILYWKKKDAILWHVILYHVGEIHFSATNAWRL